MTSTLTSPSHRIFTDEGSHLHTLREARDYLNERATDGVKCPACKQNVKIYRRKIIGQQAWALATVYKRASRGWVHLPTFTPNVMGNGGMFAKLRFWGLVENDGIARSGRWRITERGEQWLRGEIRIPTYIDTYAGESLGYAGNKTTSFRESLPKKFDYNELMAGV